MSANPSIPLDPEDLSLEWVFQILNQYRDSKNMSLISSSEEIFDMVIKERPSRYLSSTYFIKADFNVNTIMGLESLSHQFFLKILPVKSDHYRSLALETKVFRREIETTFRYFPRLTRFVSESGVKLKRFESGEDYFAPDKMYGSYDNADGSGVIVTVDEKNDYEGSSGVDLQQALAAVESIAEFHAVGAAFLRRHPEEVESDFPYLYEERYHDYDIVYSEIAPVLKLFSRFLKRIPGYIDKHMKFEKYRAAGWRVLSNSLTDRRPHTFWPLKTVVHGEFVDKNILFERRKEKDSWKPKFCDWKHAGISSPTMDLALFLLTSTTREFRNKYAKQILEKYYFTFSETLRKFDLDITRKSKDEEPRRTEDKDTCSFENFLWDYEQSLLPAFFQAACFMIREVLYLESEFNSKILLHDQTMTGEALRLYGNRLIELAEEHIPKLDSISWRNQLEVS